MVAARVRRRRPAWMITRHGRSASTVSTVLLNTVAAGAARAAA